MSTDIYNPIGSTGIDTSEEDFDLSDYVRRLIDAEILDHLRVFSVDVEIPLPSFPQKRDIMEMGAIVQDGMNDLLYDIQQCFSGSPEGEDADEVRTKAIHFIMPEITAYLAVLRKEAVLGLGPTQPEDQNLGFRTRCTSAIGLVAAFSSLLDLHGNTEAGYVQATEALHTACQGFLNTVEVYGGIIQYAQSLRNEEEEQGDLVTAVAKLTDLWYGPEDEW